MSSMLTSEILEAVLLAAGSATVNVNDIIDYYGVTEDPKDVKKQLNICIEELKAKYSGSCGIQFVITENKTMAFSTNPDYGEDVAGIMRLLKEKELSKTLLETLSIVAYVQPATKNEIVAYRNGRNCDYAINKLLEEGLIEIAGQRDTVGRPFEYKTTDKFLVKFKLSSISELPNADEVRDRFKKLNEKTAADNMFAEKEIDERDIDLNEDETIRGVLDEEEEALRELRSRNAAAELAAAEQIMQREKEALDRVKSLNDDDDNSYDDEDIAASSDVGDGYQQEHSYYESSSDYYSDNFDSDNE